MQSYSGACHCGNVSFKLTLSREPQSYEPRACDCGFCVKQGAAYISDNRGSLSFTVKEPDKLNRYRQGSGIADFLICRDCGVLVGVCYESEGVVYAAVNSRAIEGGAGFGESQEISPRLLDDSDKIARWKRLWFAGVSITEGG